jgi:hypothetical protein
MGYKMVLRPIEIIDEIRALFGSVLQEGVEIVMTHLASQAEREGSIPSTRSNICRKALRLIWRAGKTSRFTGSFTATVRESFRAASLPPSPERNET